METREYEAQRTWARADVAEERAGQSHRTSVVFGDPRKAEMIRETYRLLAVGVMAAMAGGWLGSRSDAMINLFSSGMGWILAMVLLNVVSRMVVNIARNNRRLGVPALAFDGFIKGLVLSPMLFVAMMVSGAGDTAPNLIQAALVITAAIFGGISFYVWRSKGEFEAKMSFMNGAFWVLTTSVVLNMWMHIGVFGMLITCGIGLFGCVILTHATTQVLKNREFDDPVLGAAMLMAGLFNLFQAILRLLLGSRR